VCVGLSVTTRRRADGTVEIRPRGEIDISNVGEVLDAVQVALGASAPPRIEVDLWLVTLLDSSGMGVLVTCRRAASAVCVPLVVTNPSPLVRRQLWVAGLTGLLGSVQPR
jgi:anti-anti-sigma factor